MRELLVKVCGMRAPQNVSAIADLSVDYLGFIFFEGSARFVGENFQMPPLPPSIKSVGVFVNHDLNDLIQKVQDLDLGAVQLHGEESPDYCKAFREACPGREIFKAFRLDEDYNFGETEDFESHCDFFLFDSRGKKRGGTGQKFNWSLLDAYRGKREFFLSGGIGPGDGAALHAFTHPAWVGIDLNSGFETAPALKDPNLLYSFLFQKHALHS